MAYNKTQWEDQFVNGEGQVVKQGTPVNAYNLNNMEEGIANAVTKDGGDTITGGVKFKNPTATQNNGGRISVIDGGTTVTAFDDLNTETGDRQVLKVNTVGTSNEATAVQLVRIKNGTEETFNLWHSGNKDEIKPSDIGAASASHGTHVSYSSANPVIDGAASPGSASTVARSDHKHPTDTTRAPVSHSSTGTDYGLGTSANYGHVKLSDAVNSSSSTSSGVASTPAATKAAYDLASEAKELAGKKANASHGNHVPATQTADKATFLRNDNTWQKVTPANIGAATTGHTHTLASLGAASASHSHSASDVGAVPTSRKVNGYDLSGDITLNAGDVSAVPTSRTVNGKALSANITLSASDVGADPEGSAGTVQTNLNAHTNNKNNPHGVTASQINAVPTTRTVNNKDLSSDITLNASDVGAAPDGFGLGGASKVLRDSNNLNDVIQNGWYAFPYSKPANAPCDYGWMFVCSMTEAHLSQTVYAWGDGNTTFHRTCKDGTWSEWECTSKKYGTTNLVAGTSALRNGELYFVYE